MKGKLHSTLLKRLSLFMVASLPGMALAEMPPDLQEYLLKHPDFTSAMQWDFPASELGEKVVSDTKTAQDTTTQDSDIRLKLEKSTTEREFETTRYDRTMTQRYLPILKKPNDEFTDVYFDPEWIKDLEIDWHDIPVVKTDDEPKEETPEELPPANEEVVMTQDWTQWPDDKKQKLQEDFNELWGWIESCWPKYQEFAAPANNIDVKPEGFDQCFSTAEPANYPPKNLQWMEPLPNGYSSWTVISPEDAFDLYSQMVALSLVLEIKGTFNWTIAELSQEYKNEIFNGTIWFKYVSQGANDYGIMAYPGYMVLTTVMPAPAKLTFSFMAQNKFIQPTKYDTLVKLAAWERDNLTHTGGGEIMDDCEWKNGGIYHLYKGRSPLSRVINGTVMGCPTYYPNGQGGYVKNYIAEPRHWTGGCGGTSGFNEQVLRIINFPAQRTFYGHAQNNFIIDNNERVWMGHADDTYGQSYSSYYGQAPEIPIEEILVDDVTYKSWVVDFDWKDPNLTQAQKEAYSAQNQKAVGKRSIDLMIKYMPRNMLQWACWWDQGKAHDQTYMYNSYFSLVYTIPELDSMYINEWGTNVPGVWNAIDTKTTSLGGCNVAW